MLKKALCALCLPVLWVGCSGRIEDAGPAPGYASELALLDEEIAWLGSKAGTGWSAGERLSGALAARARLTGRFDDLVEAEAVLNEAFQRAGADAGPFLARAGLNASLHRLDRVEADLRVVEGGVIVDDRLRSEVEGLRAEVAFHSGRYEDALRGYEAALRLHESVTGLARLAHYRWKTGDLARGEDLYAEAESRVHAKEGSVRAWFRLQRGLLDLDRGRYADALEDYRRADRLFPGWWLVEEHIAEALALLGQRDEAQARYRNLVARTGDPELMAALAELCAGDERRSWLDRAEAELERRIAALPEAAGGHALEFFLEHGDDPAWTLALARKNHRLRPGGDSTVLLARALQGEGIHDEAVAVVERVLETPYRSASLDLAAMEILGNAGRPRRPEPAVEGSHQGRNPNVPIRPGG